jgi:hypothetical protein
LAFAEPNLKLSDAQPFFASKSQILIWTSVGQHDPKFSFHEWPIEIRDGATRSILFRSGVIRNGYSVWVQHGFYWGEPGTPECAAISLERKCDRTAACASAQLLEMHG